MIFFAFASRADVFFFCPCREISTKLKYFDCSILFGSDCNAAETIEEIRREAQREKET